MIKASLCQSSSFLARWESIGYWCEDESRIGLHTIKRRKLTGSCIKPKGIVQWDFLYLWLYGVVEPLTGESFLYEFSHLDTICFEKFLELFAQKYPKDLHILQLDNGGFHNSLHLNLPENVMLLFQPAYSPEVNPIERLWEYIKEQLKWKTFDNLENLREAVEKSLGELSKEIVASLTGWKFILDALFVADI